MFITSKKRGYTRDGQQRAEGRFLALFCDREQKNIWGIVRYARMTQCGQFMMGSMQIGSQQITMSGTYGDDEVVKLVGEYKKNLGKKFTKGK